MWKGEKSTCSNKQEEGNCNSLFVTGCTTRNQTSRRGKSTRKRETENAYKNSVRLREPSKAMFPMHRFPTHGRTFGKERLELRGAFQGTMFGRGSSMTCPSHD